VALEDPSLYSYLAKYKIEMVAKEQWHDQPHPLVEEKWDREVIAGFGRSDAEYLKAMTYEEVEAGGGPRRVGAQMLVPDDAVAGFLSSGCVEADVVAHARACLADGEPRRLVYGRGATGRADHAGRRRGAPPAAADGGAPARLATDGIRRQCDEPAKLPPDAGVFLRDYEHPFRLLVVGHDPPRWR